jgi:hypothetical protein
MCEYNGTFGDSTAAVTGALTSAAPTLVKLFGAGAELVPDVATPVLALHPCWKL